MPESHADLATRLDALERQNRRYRRFALGALVGGTLLALQSFATPTVCDVVSAERIVLRNARGKTRLMLDAYATERPAFTLHDERGRPVTRLQVTPTGQLDVSVFQSGKPKPATLTLDGSTVGFAPLDAKAKKKESAEPLTGQGID